MDVERLKREVIDEEHLRLLALFHYISGGITIAFSSLFIFHLLLMSFFLRNPQFFPPSSTEELGPLPEQVLGFFVAFLGVFIALGIGFGIAQIVSGRFIMRRRHRIFSFVVALPNLLLIPFGTILAVFTLIVLDRKSVRQFYDSAPKLRSSG